MISDKEYIQYKKKLLARQAVTRAIKQGALVKADECELCGSNRNIEAHHCDYGKQLEVMWLCSKCHGIAHSKGHELNPDNRPQTPLSTVWEEKDTVIVSVAIPIRTFAFLKKKSEITKIALSTLIKDCIEQKYKINNQLEFDFELQDRNSNIQCVAQDKRRVPECRIPELSSICRERIYAMRKMA